MAYEAIILERIGKIGKITFNRPEVLNAFNRTLSGEIIKGVEELVADESVRTIVFTGNGRAFMAGADINMVKEWAKLDDQEKINREVGKVFNCNMIEDCPKPVIAAVNGIAFGMGCEIALGCDYRIASENAKIALPEIKLGIIPGGGGTQRMFRTVGETKAMELITTGEPIDAHEAYRIGLVNRVVADANLWEAVEDLSGKLIKQSPIALDYAKRCIYQGGAMSPRDGLEYERKLFSEILLTQDAKEGVAAFTEKRPPRFIGK